MVLLFVTTFSFGNPGLESLLNKGNQQYDEGLYLEAIESYLEVLEADVESDQLYYNLGNAYFKTNDLASAILYYEKAKRAKSKIDGAQYTVNDVKQKLAMLESNRTSMQQEYSTKAPRLIEKKKSEWYEKFHWFLRFPVEIKL